jgi:hypothetical protein
MTLCKCIFKRYTCTPCKCKTLKYLTKSVSIGVKPCTCLHDHLHLHTQHWVILTTTWASSSNWFFVGTCFYKSTKHSKKIPSVFLEAPYIYIYIYASRRRGGILCLLKSGRERSRHNYLNVDPHIISILDIKKMEIKKIK